MPLPNFHSANVESPDMFKVLPDKGRRFRTKRYKAKKTNETISLSELADMLRDKLGEVA